MFPLVIAAICDGEEVSGLWEWGGRVRMSLGNGGGRIVHDDWGVVEVL